MLTKRRDDSIQVETVGAGSGSVRPPQRLSVRARDTLAGYGFIMPVILGLILFTALPMILSLYYSFTRYDILSSPKFVGTSNYRTLLTSPTFLNSLKVTALYAVISVPLTMALGLAIAVLLNQRVPGMRVFRTLIYLPAVIPAVAAAELWKQMYSPSSYGVINTILLHIGVISKPFPFLSHPQTALASIILISLWGAGGGMIIWLAGLQSVPQQLYEAATVDGANAWWKFWRITLPMLTPTILFNLVLGIIAALQIFVTAFVIGGTDGAPLGALDFVTVFIYRHGFTYFEMGYASAAAWVLFVIILVIVLGLFRFSRSRVIYERV
jgi:multiple sugar transport system permease protein